MCPKSKAVNVEPELLPARVGSGAPSALYAWLRSPLVTVESRPLPLPAGYSAATERNGDGVASLPIPPRVRLPLLRDLIDR